MQTICLISCVKTKQNKTVAAKDLYTSALFTKNASYAATIADKWFILSAKYGLLDPEDVIDTYNETLSKASVSVKKVWSHNVYLKLLPHLNPGDSIIFLAGENYREYLIPLLGNFPVNVQVPMKGLSIGNQLKWLNSRLREIETRKHIDKFYELIRCLENGLSGKKRVSELDGKCLPAKGIYLFFEDGEVRKLKNELRVTRVGTHGVSMGAKSTLWNRLKTHKGKHDLGGNHRGSIFRLHIGNAIINKNNNRQLYSNWGVGQSAGKDITAAENDLETEVSLYIAQMKLLWLSVGDASGPASDRAYLEKNIIGLLSQSNKPIDPPSADWLGNYSLKDIIRKTGLWNLDHTGYKYDPRFLDVLEEYVGMTLGHRPVQNCSIVPDSWKKRTNSTKSRQLNLWE